MLLMFGPVCVGVLAGLAGLPFYLCLFAGVALGVLAGSLGPSFWLDKRKAAPPGSFRRSLPDALDVLVICLEGGLSLTAAFRRVGAELRTAHPLLASELNILQREMQLGQSAGEALRHFGDRADLEELRGLASVIVQSDRLGASLGHALRVHADGLRFNAHAVCRGDGSKGRDQDDVSDAAADLSGDFRGRAGTGRDPNYGPDGQSGA